MIALPIDLQLVDQCRKSARRVVRQVEGVLDRRSTVGIERTIFRLLGINSADDEGVPRANRVVDLMRAEGWLAEGAWSLAARIALACGRFGEEQVRDLIAGRVVPARADPAQVEQWAKAQAALVIAKLKSVRGERDRIINEHPVPATPWKYVIVATGDIAVDIEQACLAARCGRNVCHAGQFCADARCAGPGFR